MSRTVDSDVVDPCVHHDQLSLDERVHHPYPSLTTSLHILSPVSSFFYINTCYLSVYSPPRSYDSSNDAFYRMFLASTSYHAAPIHDLHSFADMYRDHKYHATLPHANAGPKIKNHSHAVGALYTPSCQR